MKGVYKRGNVYWISYMVNGKRYRESVGPDKKMAEDILSKRRVEVRENTFFSVQRDEKIRFEDFSKEFTNRHCMFKKSKNKFYKVFIKMLNQKFGNLYLSHIDAEMIEKYRNERVKEVQPATVNRTLAVLKVMYSKAIEWKRYHGANPVKQVKFLDEPDGRIRYLQKDELNRLLEVCEEKIRPYIIVAVGTGMRQGEQLSLKWLDVDFQNSLIYISKSIAKSNKRREIPMTEEVKSALLSIPRQANSEYIFSNKEGKSNVSLEHAFRRGLKKANIVNFRWHDLRHTFASHLVMSGVDLFTVKELLGHSNIEMTMRYSHLSQDHKKRAMRALDGLCSYQSNTTRQQPATLYNRQPENVTILSQFDNSETEETCGILATNI